MQRYRVNYRLLVGLCVGLLVVGVGGYFGLKYQLERNADQLLIRADEAEAAGELREAAGLMLSYYRQRPEDIEGGKRVANMFADILALPDVQRKDFSNALGMMEAVVRSHGESVPELRKRLAQLYADTRRWVDAQKHVDRLVNENPRDEDLQRLRATCLVNSGEKDKAISYISNVVGLNSRSGEFDSEAALGPQVVEIYPLLAQLIVEKNDDEELAERIIDQMVAANPESALAHVTRGQHLLSTNNEEDAELADADLARALTLDPEDVRVLLVSAARKRSLEDYEEARRLLEKARASHPEAGGVYRELARLELSEGQEDALEKAVAHLDEGVKKTPPGPSRSLLFYKSSVQADTGDAEGLAASIKELEKLGGLIPFRLEFLQARLLVLQGQWFKAAKLFEEVRPNVVNSPDLNGTTNYLLGACYEQLGQFDLALEALQIANALQPGNARISAALTRVGGRLDPGRSSAGADLNQLVSAELAKPENAQDWRAVEEEIDRLVDERGFDAVRADVLRADILIRRERYNEANTLLDKLLKENPDNEVVTRMSLTLMARDPERGPIGALTLYNQKVPTKFPDSVAMRLLKADLLIAIDDEALSEQLWSVVEEGAGLAPRSRVALLKGMAQKFAQVRDSDSRARALRQVVELAPGELSTLLNLFQAALASGDEARLRGVQESILEVVGGKDDPTWLFTEASRLASAAVASGGDKLMLARANDLVDRAIGSRPDWHLLYLVRADIAFARGDRAAALAALDRAEQLGPMTVPAMLRHVTLLAESGQNAEARRLIEKAAPAVRDRLLARQHAEVLARTGSIAEAIATASRFGEANRENAGAQLWLGRFLRGVSARPQTANADKQEASQKARDAFEAAVALAPAAAEGWLDLTLYHAVNGDRLAAEDVMRRAQIALPADQATIVLARGYEFVGRFFDAENLYRSLRDRRPDDLAIKRQMAEFYLSNRYRLGDKQLKASRLINEILAAAQSPAGVAEDAGANRENSIRWARRAAAGQLSATNDYQSLLKAERLLSRNAVDGRLGRGDQLLMAKILASRPEPASRLKAIELFETIKKRQPLDPRSGTTLGQLYFVTNNWDECRTQMTNVIAEARDQPGPRAAYIRMLLQQGGRNELADAASQLKILRRLSPAATETQELIARVFTALGKEEEARRVLARLLQGSGANARLAISVAGLLAELGDEELADKIYARVAEQSAAARLEYASFIGRTQDVDKAFSMLEELRDEFDVTVISRVAITVARARRRDLGEAVDEEVQKWLDRGLREDPESVPLLTLRAELYDMRQEYDEAVAIYRRLLEGGELDRRLRAVVLNNIAYLLALTSDSRETAEQAMGYVEEAVEFLGPGADILDTRAVVLTALGRPDEAIADLELSLTDKPTASKWFHKSCAHYRAGQFKEAVDAWDKAVELGLERNEVSTVEQATFDELASKINEIR